MESLKLGIIGGGVMGEALIKAVLSHKVAAQGAITVAETVPARREALASAYGVRVTASSREAAEGCTILLLAVKPQSFPEVAAEAKEHVSDGQCVLSIMAGVKIASIVQGLGCSRVVRVMPNTPAQIGEGISVWTATPEVTVEQKEQSRAILGAMGEELYVADERYLDMATALSGSGPAYVFLFLEALIDAGVHIGMPREMAQQLALQTVVGSSRYAQAAESHPAQLRNMVTSPGGTTAEALLKLEEGGFRALITRAVIAAYDKSRALGGA